MIILGLTSVLFDSFSHVREKNDLKNNRTDFQRILPELDALIRELVLFSQQFSDIFTFQERRVLNTMKNQLIPLKSLIGGWLQHGKNDLSMLRKYQSDIMNIR